jgi:thioredoxin 1
MAVIKNKGENIMSVQKINDHNFDSLKAQNKPVLLDFYADWCGPCRMVSPIVDEIADERGDIVVGKINVDESPELANRFGVFSIPTLVVIKNGEVVDQIVGARPKEHILDMLNGK